MKPGITQGLAALIAAAAAGGLTTAAGLVLAMAIQSHPYGLPSFTDIGAGGIMVVVVLLWLCVTTSGAFAVSLVVVGLPAWVALHRLGFRSRRAAALAGGLLTASTMAALALAMGGPGSGVVWFTSVMILPGAAAGWTLHRVAYGNMEPKSV